MLGELTPDEIEDLLRHSHIGRIGCHDGRRIYIVPISYIYDNGNLLCHSKDGMKISMMRANPEVCFEVDEIENQHRWRSVVAWGVYQELTDADEIEAARALFPEYLLASKTEPSSLPPHLQHDRFRQPQLVYQPAIYYRVVLFAKTGRFERSL